MDLKQLYLPVYEVFWHTSVSLCIGIWMLWDYWKYASILAPHPSKKWHVYPCNSSACRCCVVLAISFPLCCCCMILSPARNWKFSRRYWIGQRTTPPPPLHPAAPRLRLNISLAIDFRLSKSKIWNLWEKFFFLFFPFFKNFPSLGLLG